MIRVIDAHDVVVGEAKYYEYFGTSEDTKPTEKVATGSVFFEVDTSKCYMFDEDSGLWVEVG